MTTLTEAMIETKGGTAILNPVFVKDVADEDLYLIDAPQQIIHVYTKSCDWEHI